MAVALTVRLDRTAGRALGVQLADAVRRQVTDARLAAGDRLPSTRALAADLKVGRTVVEQAYAQLVAEGWLEGRHGSGTYVASGTPLTRPTSSRRTTISPTEPLLRLDSGTPWIDPRHVAGWRRAWRDVAAARAPRGYDDHRGIPELRVEIAQRLARTRGVLCDPEEVLITNGTTDGLRQLLSVLPPGGVSVDDPGYRAAVAVTRTTGRRVVDVPAPGPPPGIDLLADCAASYVTPAHQHPLGLTMSAPDRLALLDAATTTDTVIAEDDYDSEFRYDVAPVPALASLSRDHVAYLGTASKSVSPSMRLGWLVVPPSLYDDLSRVRAVTHDAAAWPVQRAYLSLLREGYVDKVIRSARRTYRDRAARVTDRLAPFGSTHAPVAGMYATLELPCVAHVSAAREAARQAGYDVPALADYCRSKPRLGLVIGFGGCTDVQLDEAITAIAGRLQELVVR